MTKTPSPSLRVLIGLGRAFAGALIFGLPMLMTMELWSSGAGMNRYRLALLVALALPLLVGVAHRIGFEPTFGWCEDVRDAAIALAVGVVASGVILFAFGVAHPSDAPLAVTGQVAVQAVLGALLARSQFGAGAEDEDGAEPAAEQALSGWAGSLFLMLVGAIFLSLNVAPTEEMILISFLMTPWHALALIGLSLAIVHGFVYALAFRRDQGHVDAPAWRLFCRFTLTGYTLCLAISLYVLWTFGRLDALAVAPAAMATVVLAFPAAVGAAAARLIL